jgi:hypothetical protein
MVGRGGAVLAVPALVYVVGLGVHAATTVSLAVVAATGAIGQVFIGFRTHTFLAQILQQAR